MKSKGESSDTFSLNVLLDQSCVFVKRQLPHSKERKFLSQSVLRRIALGAKICQWLREPSDGSN